MNFIGFILFISIPFFIGRKNYKAVLFVLAGIALLYLTYIPGILYMLTCRHDCL